MIPGTRIGPYEVIAKIGEGGMGEVYRATDTKLQRDAALKILPEGVTTDPDRLARFTREAQVLASLNHPNIAGIYSFEDASGTPVLAMEFVEGEDLSQRIARGRHPARRCIADREADRRRTRSRPRTRHRPSRSQASGGLSQISWAADGRTLYYFMARGGLSIQTRSVSVTAAKGGGSIGRPVDMVPPGDFPNGMSFPPIDGRLLARRPVVDAPPTEYRVILNWTEELKTLAPRR